MKIANDLRWMNSGPVAGLSEIRLPELQKGSSIMPGKVNPVIPEAVAMVAAQIIGMDAAIAVGAQDGWFQLNTMLPLIGRNLLEQMRLGTAAARVLADKAIRGLTVERERLAQQAARNPMLATALNPHIGYDLAGQIARRSLAEGRTVLDVAAEMTALSQDELASLLDPLRMARGE